MTEISIQTNSIRIKGHANSTTKKPDLVCCAISAIIYTSTSWFLKKDIDFIENKKETTIELKLINKSIENQKLISLVAKQLKFLSKNNTKYITILK